MGLLDNLEYSPAEPQPQGAFMRGLLNLISPPDPRLAATFERNKQFTKPDAQNFSTFLPPPQEQLFRQWVAENNVPFNPHANGPSDYDMRGFWQALQQGHPRAVSAIDPNDNQLHYPDFWKTPYHETFSNESQWATPNAPRWTEDDKLVGPDGRILFDDRAPKRGR